MPVTVEWHNPEKTALRFAFSGVLHLDELRRARLEGDLLLDTVTHSVVIVFDFRDVTRLAMGAFGKLQPALDQPHHRNTGQMMINVGLNQLLSMLGQIAKRLYPQVYAGRDMRFVRTLDEADRILQAYTANASSASPLS
jgi:hypothetical protein